MKTNLFIILLVGLLFSFSAAQEKTDTLKIFKTNSLQFGVSNLFSLRSFKGALISYKYHFDDNMAIQVGVSINFRQTNEDENRHIFYSDTSLFDQKRNNTRSGIRFVSQYLQYFNSEDEIKLFIGIGPQFEISIYDLETDEIKTAGDIYGYDKKRIDDRYTIGLSCSLGVEWFFKSNMSLHAEYGFYGYYIYEKYHRTTIYDFSINPDRIEERKGENTGWGFDNASALFGLSVYF